MLGVVNLDKPSGPTSHDMVALLRRLTGTRRIGHAGTLDPLASGVLPILVGPATRLSEELTAGEKRYEAVIRLGWRSETDDAEGRLERGDTPPPAPERVAEELQTFVGTFEQRPPAYSARKQGGRTAHRAARAGAPLELAPQRVTIDRIELLELTPGDDRLDARIDLRCGPGTYVRSLARDLGERLGCGGYLLRLRRTEAAGLRVEEAVTPEQLETLAGEGRLEEVLLPPAALLRLPHLQLDEAAAERFLHGSTMRLPPAHVPGRHAVFAGERLLGIGTVMNGSLQPNKVLETVA
jgi:tRNA pseudouridine55 synthase